MTPQMQINGLPLTDGQVSTILVALEKLSKHVGDESPYMTKVYGTHIEAIRRLAHHQPGAVE
jgi:hypothetical protein